MAQLAASTALHLTFVVIAVWAATTPPDQRSQTAYTKEALRARIQGTVLLEAVITNDGCTSQLRIVRALDPGGLDEEALTAVSQWRFDPGRLGAAPVDVLVTIVLDFAIH